jgi:CheY-like chemotaxis protein
MMGKRQGQEIGSPMKLRAIVIDDNEEIRSVISSIMELWGYEVLSSPEPLVCPVYLDSECPCPYDYACMDVLITDNRMPKMTGLDFIENQTRNGCKAIVRNKAVISGNWAEEELEHAKRLGCQIFNKPFKVEQITKWLDECEKRIDPNRELAELPVREKNE